MKTVLTIQSQVAGAPVGNSVAVFALQRLGLNAIALPTTLLGRRPDRGPPGGGPIDVALLNAMFDALEADGALPKIDAVLSGYLAHPDQAAFVLDAAARVKAANPNAYWVCDPVMGDGKLYVREDVAEAFVTSLVPEADVVAPNFWELGRLAGRDLASLADARSAARRFGKPMLISSVPTEAGVGVLYTAQTGDWLVETPKLPNAPRGGAGDLLTALFLARRLKGEGAAVALEGAVGGVHDALVRAIADQSDDLWPGRAPDVIVEPETWPRAQRLE